jgi:hypothetical protein
METSENKNALVGNIHRPIGVIVVALFMVFAGFAEVITGFRHNFFGITTSGADLFTYSSAIIGAFYALAGLLILSMKKRAAILAISLLVIDILGRITLVLTGLYPMDSLKNIFSIIAGTLIVAMIIIYIIMKLKYFK